MSNIIFKTLLLKGEAGNNIQSIEKTATSGLIDTYTVTLSDGSTSTFDVYNGKEITTVEKTATSGLEDTYTITYNDNSTDTFTVTNGNGITSIVKTATSGLEDTYTITYSNGTTSTFVVTNGANGSDLNLAYKEDTTTASKAHQQSEYLLLNGFLYRVTRYVPQGGTLEEGYNITRTIICDEIDALDDKLSAKIQDNQITIKGSMGDISNEELTLTASYSYSKGEYFYLHRGASEGSMPDGVYRALTNINAGNAITLTNCVGITNTFLDLIHRNTRFFKGAYTGDIDELVENSFEHAGSFATGVYWVKKSGASGNQPNANYYTLLVIGNCQIFLMLNTSTTSSASIGYRIFINGSWTVWRKVTMTV